ncbi:MAG: hypothetical protein ACI8UD_001895 [Planctomycetota bacterium]
MFDPANDQWFAVGSLATARRFHSAVRLGHGKVLMLGGLASAGTPLTSCEFYDPVAGTFSSTGSGLRVAIGRRGLQFADRHGEMLRQDRLGHQSGDPSFGSFC